MTLEEVRIEIDKIDDQLLSLINQRMTWVQTVGEIKKQSKAVIYRPEREKQILDRMQAQNHGPLNRQAIEAIYLEIFAAARNIELPERIAFLGPEGSFTHQAAESRFGAVSEYMTLPTIKSVFEAVDTSRAKFGVIPIENNQEGIVYETVDLLNEMNVNIAAELKIPVHFTLATEAENPSKIKRIYSKDIAFRQCRGFLNKYFEQTQPEEIQVESTSKAAKLASEDPEAAAICSEIAAKLFRIPILFNNIEDNSNNRTRFFILSKNFENQPSGNDKTTIIARLPDTDKPGILAGFLQDFKKVGINLTKIESRPFKGDEDFNFWFFIELLGYHKDENFQKIIKKHRDYIKVLGSYVRNA
ncbi:prephenate dehydratase [Emticicia sp. CRIBPO]|uniref:prephenate dehydratase n=1 Tax=Emticicia sp. CRIBPO TaxID=2683258 RepID=UPI001412D2DA|nr:prephenate dehydratase [Emticicia sp. CRIBPO]NBA87514.1 prephenate dehydratase [Emticicia sp. CRIBPO]